MIAGYQKCQWNGKILSSAAERRSDRCILQHPLSMLGGFSAPRWNGDRLSLDLPCDFSTPKGPRCLAGDWCPDMHVRPTLTLPQRS